MPISEKTSPTDEAVREELEFEAFLEKVNKSGHPVVRGWSPFFKPRDWAAEQVMDVWAGKYTRNIVLQYQDILKHQDIRILHNILGGKHPAAVVGAGPSLDKNIRLLRDFPGLILACDGAAIPLTARGINPDIVVCVDPRQSVIAEMIDYTENKDQILASSVYVAPDVSAAWKGKKIYFSTLHEGTQFHDSILPALFPGMPGLYATGNVGNTAVQLASVIGAKKIILVGQDYGYSGGRFRCSPWEFSKESQIWSRLGEEKNEAALDHRTGKAIVDGVETYSAFVDYRKTLGMIVENLKLDVVNATEGGILNNIPCKTLAEVIDDLKSKNNKADEAHALLAKATGGIQ